MNFEIRKIIRNGFTEVASGNTKTIVFSITPVIGITGNPYPSFLNSDNVITVNCDKGMTGDQMDAQIISACNTFLTNTFPAI
jgi:hypothetical protein